MARFMKVSGAWANDTAVARATCHLESATAGNGATVFGKGGARLQIVPRAPLHQGEGGSPAVRLKSARAHLRGLGSFLQCSEEETKHASTEDAENTHPKATVGRDAQPCAPDENEQIVGWGVVQLVRENGISTILSGSRLSNHVSSWTALVNCSRHDCDRRRASVCESSVSYVQVLLVRADVGACCVSCAGCAVCARRGCADRGRVAV